MVARMSERVDRLVALPRRVAPQPTPEIHPGGDCGACVLAGLLGISLEEVYGQLQERKDGAPPRSFEHYSMIEALRRAHFDFRKVDRYITEMPSWTPQYSAAMQAWGRPSWMQSGAWFDYLTMALEAGFYAIAMVDAEKRGPLGGGTNHWILLCGTRLHWQEGSGAYEVLVSCSSRKTPDEEWVEAGPFLQERGGFGLLLARPTP